MAKYVKRIAFSDEQMFTLINLYRKNECLWDVRSPEYKNAVKRKRALSNIDNTLILRQLKCYSCRLLCETVALCEPVCETAALVFLYITIFVSCLYFRWRAIFLCRLCQIFFSNFFSKINFNTIIISH